MTASNSPLITITSPSASSGVGTWPSTGQAMKAASPGAKAGNTAARPGPRGVDCPRTEAERSAVADIMLDRQFGADGPNQKRVSEFIVSVIPPHHSTVTLFARFLGLSTSVPLASAVWYASSCSGTTCRMGESAP